MINDEMQTTANNPQRKPNEKPEKLFIKNIPAESTKEQITLFCANFGEVLDCELRPSRKDNRFATAKVVYATADNVKFAMTQINSMKNEDINLEASIFIEPQSENLSENIVEISNMPENMSFNDVIRLFSTYGEIRGMNINNDNPSFRIGYVNYKNPESAKSAVSELKDFKTEDMTTPLQIRFARKKNFSPSTKTNFTNLNSRNILLTNIPMEWDEPMLSKLLSDCGTVIWAKMDLNLKLRKKAATATFEDPETARNAVQRLNGLSVDNKDRKLSARIVSETRAQDGRTVETGDSCKYFDRGYCYRGSNCWFAHENRENFDGKSAPRYRTRYLGGGVTEEVSSKGHAFFTTKNKK